MAVRNAHQGVCCTPKPPKLPRNMTELHQDTVHELSLPDCTKKETLQTAQMQAQCKHKIALKQVQVMLQKLQTGSSHVRPVPLLQYPQMPPQPDVAKFEHRYMSLAEHTQSGAPEHSHAQMELQILETRLGQVRSAHFVVQRLVLVRCSPFTCACCSGARFGCFGARKFLRPTGTSLDPMLMSLCQIAVRIHRAGLKDSARFAEPGHGDFHSPQICPTCTNVLL